MSTFFNEQPSPKSIEEKIKGFSSWFEIDLDNIGHNLNKIRNHTKTEVMAVVKNNAYGHGLIPVTAYLEEQNVKWCMVAKLYEALNIRRAGLSLGILNMDVLFTPEQYKNVVEEQITQTVYTKEDADKLSTAAGQLGKTAYVFVKVDTGLNRVGVRHTEAADLVEYIERLQDVEVSGMVSTFQQIPEMDQETLNKLLRVDDELRGRGTKIPIKSMASTDATLHNPKGWLDLVARAALSLK